ncbi:MAG: ABC transporter ATP-binding protein [Nonlabens sp.]|uniref:ABC transporter ATP-binding protein n=1 Tax=Nonlabens sp. TaxID=1888209 RepID=UPI003EFA632B
MIELHNIEIGYGHCVIAQYDGVLACAKGKFITLIGANGSGKSTLLRAISSNQHIIKGKVHINNVNSHNINSLEKSKLLSVVLTTREFSQFLTIEEILYLSRAPYTNFIGKLTPADLDFVDGIMEDFGIIEMRKRRLSTLSDGQLQRVLIARALVQDTPYILMDEPTSHLDVHHKAEILLKLRDYCHQHNKCIIFSSHELSIALSLADEVIAIHDLKLTFQSKEDFIASSILEKMFPSPLLDFKNGKLGLNI